MCFDVFDVFQKTRIDSELEGEDIDKAKNVGFRVRDQGIVTYEQNKLGLSGYYDKAPIIDAFTTFKSCKNIHAKCVCFAKKVYCFCAATVKFEYISCH